MGSVRSRVIILGTGTEALNLHRMDRCGHGQDLHNSQRRVPGAPAPLTVQALTPDALDLTLMAHYRPPSPVIVLMSFFAAADDDEDASSRLTTRSPRSALPCTLSTNQGESSDDEPADNIWQPLWPEIGLARGLPIQLRALPKRSLLYVD